AAFAMRRASPPLDLQLHQALRREADHLAQQFGVRALFQKRAKRHLLVGHRWFLESGCVLQPDLTGEPSMAIREAARSLQRYLGRASRAASLHRPTPRPGT